MDPVLDMAELETKFRQVAPPMAEALYTQGYYTTTDFLPPFLIARLRRQCVALRHHDGRFEPSWSETVDVHGRTTRFDKPGVLACEPDGRDYDTAPDLIVYLSVLVQTLPVALNQQQQPSSSSMQSSDNTPMDLSDAAFNAKLAVTLPGGSVYPMHIDNPQGMAAAAGDTRKLTCILYLNPQYESGDGGELQIVTNTTTTNTTASEQQQQQHPDKDKRYDTIDLTPVGGRLVAFWSDQMPHQVLPTAPHAAADDARYDRYALTVWIPTHNAASLHPPQSKFRHLADVVAVSSRPQ